MIHSLMMIDRDGITFDNVLLLYILVAALCVLVSALFMEVRRINRYIGHIITITDLLTKGLKLEKEKEDLDTKWQLKQT